MWRILAIIFTGIIFSFYYFPFEFSFLPGINTKMGLAVVGILIAAFNLIRKREIHFPQNLVTVVVGAVLVSLVGVVSVIYNNTPDYAYATYFVSMMVWLSGAYAICSLIKCLHGDITVERITVYMACICVAQCVSALIIDSNVAIKHIVDRFILQDQEFLTKVERLYGIGASLDTAGVRFSICLLLLTYVINKYKGRMSNGLILISVTAFGVIALVGNMIARTTIVGVLLSIIYAMMVFRPQRLSYGLFNMMRVVFLVMLVAIPLCVYLYNNNTQFHELSRFAF